MKLVKSSVALLLSAALVSSVVQGEFSVTSAEGTNARVCKASATATVQPTQTPTATVQPTQTPKSTATVQPTQTPKSTATAKSTSTPKPTATVKPTSTPAPTIKNKKPKAPKISCKAAGKGKIIVKYNSVKNAKGLEIRWYGKGGYKKSGRYNLVYGKETDGTFLVKKGKFNITELKKGKYTVMVRAYSAGSKPKSAWITRGSFFSKWVKKTVIVKKSGTSSMNYNEG